MKILISILLTLLLSNVAQASVIKSTRLGTGVLVSRIVDLVKLVNNPDIQINVAIKDLGGSTDVSPSQVLFFTLYSKGEMFSTDATFNLGAIYDFKMARKISNGIFEIFVGGVDFETSMPKNKLLIIDAQKAIAEILKVKCDDFDCPASEKFEASIIVIEK